MGKGEIKHTYILYLHRFQVKDSKIVQSFDGCRGNGEGRVCEGRGRGGVAGWTIVKKDGIEQLH